MVPTVAGRAIPCSKTSCALYRRTSGRWHKLGEALSCISVGKLITHKFLAGAGSSKAVEIEGH